VNCNYLIK